MPVRQRYTVEVTTTVVVKDMVSDSRIEEFTVVCEGSGDSERGVDALIIGVMARTDKKAQSHIAAVLVNETARLKR